MSIRAACAETPTRFDYFEREANTDDFIHHGNEMLNAVAAFWDGLDKERQGIGADPSTPAS
ncbi:MAG TPA: hypothetical protein VLJ79_32510 [Candidatus Binatia bacterium]|nr:hypothetical protein [Candidatus Binatia bacterium]